MYLEVERKFAHLTTYPHPLHLITTTTAKIRRGGDFINSRFEELSIPDQIAHYVAQVTGSRKTERESFGLKKMAAFGTVRESWLADGEFGIVQDVTDFGHMVGEVEVEWESEGCKDGEERMKAKMEEMDARIAAFMGRYSWAFYMGVPKGKLMAYLERVGG
ncbi:hypothetical protein BO70DRAFT_397689 [Aspergillus heteromorphus CBS 117.55]|uniref:CYTH domain-containing protein n=1 Tax=Aspergillus heteromorphus CBS 117.55 TaxID=1448321 RepID=A0A317VWN9_9EURO|nr:uncharacterized protein BO70DRAFT_397689 [Aspergillus heteromorphus CBS 117.55]PWY77402.1 hypothetical protein BO70DRAFT_397689 [Aspergillus heteromorphus CBS 117.55]